MKLILKLGIFLAIILSSLLGLAENKPDKIFNIFNGKEEVTALSFSKSQPKPFEIIFVDKSKRALYKMEQVRYMTYNQKKGELIAFNIFPKMVKEHYCKSYFEIETKQIDCENCYI